jgi:hypothetical protein
MILVTGGVEFIGATFVLDWLSQSDEAAINLDVLTYAGNGKNLTLLDGLSDGNGKLYCVKQWLFRRFYRVKLIFFKRANQVLAQLFYQNCLGNNNFRLDESIQKHFSEVFV